MKQSKIYIYGKHAVVEAIKHSPRAITKVLLAEKFKDKEFMNMVRDNMIGIGELDERQATSQVEGGAAHQGIIAILSLAELVIPFEHFIEKFSPTPDTCLVFLSEVQDPHNVGAIIRSAAALGASAVLMPTYKQSPVTGAAIKASAGMAFTIPLISVENVQGAIAALKKMGVRVHGLAGQGNKSINIEEFAEPTMLVVGNEAEGIAPAALALCDQTLSIPISQRAESLNVAASAAVALYAWSRKHPQF